MKKTNKIALLILTAMINLNICYASTIEDVLGENAGEAREVDKSFASRFLGVFQWFAYGISLGMLIYIGIKYVMSAADEKADLKKSLIKYVIGAVLISGATAVATLIFSVPEV